MSETPHSEPAISDTTEEQLPDAPSPSEGDPTVTPEVTEEPATHAQAPDEATESAEETEEAEEKVTDQAVVVR